MKIFYTSVLFLILGLGSLFAKDMKLQELSKYNGKDGKKTYIAVEGKIYDVTGNRVWVDGSYTPTKGRLQSGIDATQVIDKAHQGKKVLAKLAVVGNLIK